VPTDFELLVDRAFRGRIGDRGSALPCSGRFAAGCDGSSRPFTDRVDGEHLHARDSRSATRSGPPNGGPAAASQHVGLPQMAAVR